MLIVIIITHDNNTWHDVSIQSCPFVLYVFFHTYFIGWSNKHNQQPAFQNLT